MKKSSKRKKGCHRGLDIVNFQGEESAGEESQQSSEELVGWDFKNRRGVTADEHQKRRKRKSKLQMDKVTTEKLTIVSILRWNRDRLSASIDLPASRDGPGSKASPSSRLSNNKTVLTNQGAASRPASRVLSAEDREIPSPVLLPRETDKLAQKFEQEFVGPPTICLQVAERKSSSVKK